MVETVDWTGIYWSVICIVGNVVFCFSMNAGEAQECIQCGSAET
jgi:hypothetical protein